MLTRAALAALSFSGLTALSFLLAGTPLIDSNVAWAGTAEQPELLLASAEMELSGASRYRTHAQQLIEDLVSAGESDLDALIALVVTDSREVLDHLVINLAEQRIYEVNVAGEMLSVEKVSTGTRGRDTPIGEYHIVNKAPKAYSQKYDAWMLHWHAITADGQYGIHGLEGSSYERRLGRVASHGCIRISRAYAKDLYGRTQVGMEVIVVKDPDFKLERYQPISEQAALAMVLDILSPADPEELFY